MKVSTVILVIFILSASVAAAQSPDYIFVFLNNKLDKAKLPEEEVKKIMEGHMANIARLANEGKLRAAGPFDGGGGIFIFKSNSKEEVRDWISTDPGVQANRWNVEILPYFPQYGSICKVGELYQMVTYQFIRYTAAKNVPKATLRARAIKKHRDYLKSLRESSTIITEATFGDGEGILIVKGDLTDDMIKADPAVHGGKLETEVKKLWIAKGSFCEK